MQRFIASALVVGSIMSGLVASGKGPQSSSRLSAVLESVTKAGYDSVTEISLDDGQWEVESPKNGKPVGLRIDSSSIAVLSEYPDEPHPVVPKNAMSLAEIVRGLLEKADYTSIRKIDFERTGWEVKAFHGGSYRELFLDLNGKILVDKPED